MLLNRMKLAAIGAVSTVGTLGMALATHAQIDPVASGTQAITDAGESVFDVFFGMLPSILLVVIPIILVLWGVRWMLSSFRGGRR